MGHIYVDVVVKSSRGEISLRNVIVDAGASYTVLSKEVVEKVGAWPIPYTVRLELGDSRAVEADIYAIIVRLNPISISGRYHFTPKTFISTRLTMGLPLSMLVNGTFMRLPKREA